MSRRRSEFPEPPAHLSERSQALWCDLGPRNCPETGRRVLFQQALESLDRADAARAAVAAEGITTTTERSGVAHAHPMIRVESDARRQFFRLWTALGFQYRDSGL